jgi:putative tricarboxylic transport membrane protein
VKQASLSAWAGEAAVSLALAVLGLFLALSAWRMPFGTGSAPGPGILPFVLGLVMAGLGVIAALKALWSKHDKKPVSVGSERALLCILVLFGAALAFVPFGFVPTSFVFLSILFYGLGERLFVEATAAGAGATLFAWLVFDKALGVGLPQGIFAP